MALDLAKPLDDVDWQVLTVLQEDGRISFSELGRRVAMSAPAVAERVRRLEEAGVITGYRAQVDLARLGYPIQAVVRLRTDYADKDHFEKTVCDLPQVLECLRVTGEDCYVIKILATAVTELDSAMNGLAEFGSTTTSVVVGQPLETRVVGPPPASGESPD